MKKLLPIIKLFHCSIVLLLYCSIALLFPTVISAAETGNKFGLNVAARVDQIDMGVADYVKQDGWVVMMPNATNYDSNTANNVYNEIVGSYFTKMGSRVNYILRAHHPYSSNPDFTGHPTFPDKTDSQWAVKWADFWSSIINRLPIPSGSAFYVIPWNEPNLQRECAGIGNAYDANDCGCASYVLEYINQLDSKLDKSKAKLLTPAFAVSAPNFYKFSQCLGGSGFFSRFAGISLDYYDFETGCTEPFCNSDPMFNPNLYPQLLTNIGASGKPLFMVETGLVSPSGCAAGVPDCPNFTQPDITLMLCQLYNNHKSDSSFIMFSPLTYNPEKSEGNWFWDTSETKDFYQERSENCEIFKEEETITVQGPAPGFFDAVITGKHEITEKTPVATPPPTPPANSQRSSLTRNLLGLVLGSSLEKTGAVSGTVNYEKIVFPDFSGLSTIFAYATRTFLPQRIDTSFSGTPVAKIKTEVSPLSASETGFGGSEDTAGTLCDNAAEHEQELEGYRDSALGAVALNGLFLPIHLLKEKQLFENYRYQIEDVDYACNPGFGPGAESEKKDLPSPEPKNPIIQLSFINIITNTIKDFIEGIWHIFEREQESKVKMAFKAQIPAMSKAASYAKTMGSAVLPASLVSKFEPQDEAKALTTGDQTDGAKATVTFGDFSGDTTSPVIYAQAGTQRNFSCAAVCGSYPEKVVKGGNEVFGSSCPKSCNPKDYQAPPKSFIPLPTPPAVPANCHWNEAYGCDYWTCQYDRQDPEKKAVDDNGVKTGNVCGGCGENEVPFCEDTNATYIKCATPQSLNIPKDVRLENGGPCPAGAPGYDKVCLAAGGGECESLTFTSSVEFYQNHPDLAEARGLTEYINTLAKTKADGPPWGPCFYASLPVCVKKGGWDDWNNCAVGCAPLCCGSGERLYQ